MGTDGVGLVSLLEEGRTAVGDALVRLAAAQEQLRAVGEGLDGETPGWELRLILIEGLGEVSVAAVEVTRALRVWARADLMQGHTA